MSTDPADLAGAPTECHRGTETAGPQAGHGGVASTAGNALASTLPTVRPGWAGRPAAAKSCGPLAFPAPARRGNGSGGHPEAESNASCSGGNLPRYSCFGPVVVAPPHRHLGGGKGRPLPCCSPPNLAMNGRQYYHNWGIQYLHLLGPHWVSSTAGCMPRNSRDAPAHFVGRTPPHPSSKSGEAPCRSRRTTPTTANRQKKKENQSKKTKIKCLKWFSNNRSIEYLPRQSIGRKKNSPSLSLSLIFPLLSQFIYNESK